MDNAFIEDIKNYKPYNIQEKNDKELILLAVNNFNNLFTRENPILHFTSSGYIINKTRDKVLMIYHKIYNSWAWTGGHNDGDTNFLRVAIKEAQEETGLKNINVISDDIFSIDVLTVNGHIKKNKFVSAHLHLNITYLLEVLGYKTQLLEFIDISHSPKNILIRASKAKISKEKREKALNEVKSLMENFNLSPTLFNLLQDEGLI